jgi:hypothetical protein
MFVNDPQIKNKSFFTVRMVKKWRSEGKQIIMYLDDGIGIDPDEQLCQHIVNEVKIDLIKSGLVPKAEKSFWQPLFYKWSGNLCKRITCRS